MEQSAVSAQHLAIGYSLGKGRWKTVHPCVDFTLNLGELTSLIGLNGAGKSTLIKTLCRFQPPVGGSVSVMGKDVREYAPHEFALTVGVVLTDRTNAGGLTVRELVSLGRQPHTGFLGHLGDRDRIVVSAAMDSVGISHKADSYVSELSDGERQRAMIAKALAQECPVIVLDEPTAFLDVASRIETMSLLHETARRQHVSGSPEDLVLDGSLKAFFGQRGMNFDVRSGQLSTGVSGPEVGVDGEGLTARWTANALARNGFTPVLPADGIPCVRCLSPTCLEVSHPGSATSVTVSCISQAVSLLIDYKGLK